MQEALGQWVQFQQEGAWAKVQKQEGQQLYSRCYLAWCNDFAQQSPGLVGYGAFGRGWPGLCLALVFSRLVVISIGTHFHVVHGLS